MPVPKGQKGVEKIMHEYKKGSLHSGGSGKVVKNRKQAIAIALSEAGLNKDGMKRSLHGSKTFTPAEITQGYRSLGPATDPRHDKQRG